jgi:hypothetical protein
LEDDVQLAEGRLGGRLEQGLEGPGLGGRAERQPDVVHGLVLERLEHHVGLAQGQLLREEPAGPVAHGEDQHRVVGDGHGQVVLLGQRGVDRAPVDEREPRIPHGRLLLGAPRSEFLHV